MKCSKCGAELPENSAFCPRCGQAFSANAQENPGAPNPQGDASRGGAGYSQPPVYVQQPVYVQPQPIYVQAQPAFAQSRPAAASPAEKDALFSTTSSIWMLIAAIVFTLNLIAESISGIIDMKLWGILTLVFYIIMDVGFWILYAAGRKKKLGSKGISLIKVTYVIEFVCTVLSFVGNLLIWFITLNAISIIMGILTFVFQCICFASVKKTLDMAGAINNDISVAGRKAGVFAAVVMIISSALSLVSRIISYFVMAALLEALKDTPLAALASMLSGGSVMVIIAAVISFLASISVAIVLLQFAKRIERANG